MKKKIGFFIMIGSISVFMAGCKDTQDVIEQENPEIAETEYKVAEEEMENVERDCGEESDEIENWSWMEENEDDSRFQVEGQEPFYEYYYDEDGELFLTLYYDEETKQGKGISYGYGSENNKIGFTFDKYEEQIWTKTELLTYDGVPLEKSWLMLKDIETFQEYDENGRLSHYKYAGYADSSNTLDDEKMEVVCEIAYIYRDNGTLWKKYGNLSGVYYYDYKNSYFDELGRETFSDEYITHGSLQKYYIYDGEAEKPKYCFVFDSGWDAYMIKYN